MAVVYRHRRLDTNQIFYVGIGNIKRPNKKTGRSVWWNRVISKTPYEVEIIAEGLDWDTACELETLLISEYGRKDLGLGNLVNMTDGGEGCLGYKLTEKHKEAIRNSKIGEMNPMYGKDFSQEHRDKMSVARSGDKHFNFNCEVTDELRERMSKASKGKLIGGKHHQARKVINTETGEIYNCIKDVVEISGLKYSALSSQLRGDNCNKTIFKLLEGGGNFETHL